MNHEPDHGAWLFEALRSLGVNIDELAKTLPHETALALKHPDTIEPDDLNRILLACAEQTGDEHIGLRLAECIEPSAFGTFGYLLLNARTVGEFLTLAERYYPVFYQGATLEVTQLAKAWRIAYRRTDVARVAQRHDNEWTLGTLVRIMRSKLGFNWHPRRTKFQNPAPSNLLQLQRVFGETILFNQAFNCFEVDNSSLGMPLNNSDPQLLKIIQEHAEGLLNRAARTQSVEAQLRLAIMQALESGTPKAGDVARRMGMSLTTLKRRLSERDLTFRALRDSVISELAKRALAETNVSVSKVAMQLGYSEVSAFNHAFSRLIGTSPLAYRREARGAP